MTAPTLPRPAEVHEAHHGFCMVCGSVWPCSRATTTREALPVPRPDEVAR